MTHSPTAQNVEDAVTAQLVRLMELCEQHGLDLDLMFNEARRIHDREPEFGT